MALLLFKTPVFGPITSRRLGASLGVNLLPTDGKLCNFDCLYCECGFNEDHRPAEKMPTARVVLDALETRLEALARDRRRVDAITFAGNGEPTMHPEFPAVVEGVAALRDRFQPDAKIALLTNAARLLVPGVLESMRLIDLPMLKLDAVDDEYVRFVDRPQCRYSVKAVLEAMGRLETPFWIQTMFMRGEHEGRSVDNTTEAFVAPWLEALLALKPAGVSIYTLDRDTPIDTLVKCTPAELDRIAERVRAAGLNVQVSY